MPVSWTLATQKQTVTEVMSEHITTVDRLLNRALATQKTYGLENRCIALGNSYLNR